MVERRAAGLALVAPATLIAGLGGYAITVVAARGLGTDYAAFASFWSGLYLVIGALAGIQQELSRASRPAGADGPRSGSLILRRFALLAGGVVLAVVLVAGLLVLPMVIPGPGAILAVPLALGAASYVAVAGGTGVLYGTSAWRPLALVIVLDVVVRLALIALVLALGGGLIEAAWTAVIPFPIVIVTLLIVLRLEGVRGYLLDVPLRSLARNTISTVAAGLASSVIVNGMPLLVGLIGTEASASELSALIFALILTRAPLVVGVLALQSYLVVDFRARARAATRQAILLCGAVLGTGVVLAGAAYLLAADVIVLLVGQDSYRLAPLVLAMLTLASASTGMLAVSGAAALGSGRHRLYVAGWTAAAVGTLLLLAVPLDLSGRVVLALSIGPLLGVIVHLAGLGFVRPGRVGAEDPAR